MKSNAEKMNDLLDYLSVEHDVTVEEIVDAVGKKVIDLILCLKDIKPYPKNLKKLENKN